MRRKYLEHGMNTLNKVRVEFFDAIRGFVDSNYIGHFFRVVIASLTDPVDTLPQKYSLYSIRLFRRSANEIVWYV